MCQNRDVDRAVLLAKYKGGFSAVEDALAGIAEAELDAEPGGGEWSPRMVVHHLADSEATAYVRLRRLIAEEQPIISGYDEVAFSQRLNYGRPIEPSLTVLQAVRASSWQLLESLDDHQWQKTGTHSESGPYSVEAWLEIYANHPYEHASQIERARAAGGEQTGPE